MDVFGLASVVIAALASSTGDLEVDESRVRWVVAQRHFELGTWRSQLAAGPLGQLWLGGGFLPGSVPGHVYQWDGRTWTLLPPIGPVDSRTLALSADPAGGLWLAPFVPDSEITYRSLTLARWHQGSWSTRVLEPGLWPQGMAFVAPEEGWIVGNRGRIVHVVGERWAEQTLELLGPPGDAIDLLAIEMGGRDDGWLVGSRGTVARYQGGRWRQVAVPPEFVGQKLFDVSLAPDGRVWVVGSGGLLASWDGVWRVWPVPVKGVLNAIDVVTADAGWAVGEAGLILRFDGRAWVREPSPIADSLLDVVVTNPEEGWIASSSAVLRTTTWDPLLLRDRTSDHPEFARRGATHLAALDLDGDGDLELGSLSAEGLVVFEHRGSAGLQARPLPQALAGERKVPLQAAAWGDLDGDRRIDVLALGQDEGPALFFRQRGELSFEAPRVSAVGPVSTRFDTVSMLDVDANDTLDVYLTRAGLAAPAPLVDRLFLNDGSGRLSWRSMATGTREFDACTLWGDLDGDLDLDLVLPASGTHLDLFLNDGGELRQATARSGLDRLDLVGTIRQGALFDLDRDGDLDMLLLGRELYPLLNDGAAHFTLEPELFEPISNNPGLGSSQLSFGDLDGDGYPEVFFSTVEGAQPRARLVSRSADGRYRDVTAAAGVEGLAGTAVVFADFDGDGDLDLLATFWERGFVVENRRERGRFLKVRPRGEMPGAIASGAQVRLYEAGHLGDPEHLLGFQSVGVGLPASSFTHASELVFGVPPGRRVDVEVRFLRGRRVVRLAVAAGSTVEIAERPWPVHVAVALGRQTRRAVLRAAPAAEGAKLVVLALAILALWLLARQHQAPWFLRGPVMAPLASGAYVLGSVAAADAEPPWRHVVPFMAAGLLPAMAVLAARAWSRWRLARYLGPYRLEVVLGEGGMGVVYRARHVVTRARVALKVLHPRATAGEENRVRFLREAEIMTRLAHPNVVRVFETGEIGGRGFISMEELAGRPLGAWVEAQGPFSPTTAALALAAAAEALAHVHKQAVVHRDVKTDNLFLQAGEPPLPSDLEGWGRRLKLMDFGLAMGPDMGRLTAAETCLGTFAYLAPEQLRAGAKPDPRSDLYALGVVGVELLTGRLPATVTTASTPEEMLRRWVSAGAGAAELVELLLQMLSVDAAARPASAAWVAGACAAFAQGRRPEPAEPEGTARKALAGAAAAGFASTTTRAFQQRLLEIRRCLGEGRVTEAQVLLVALLAELRRRLQVLQPEERARYAARHPVADVLALERELLSGGS